MPGVTEGCHWNAQCWMFCCQAIFSLMAMAFCMAMIATDREIQVFLPMLTSVVSVWMPSPNLPRKEPPGNTSPAKT